MASESVAKDRAKRLLKYYFSRLSKPSDLGWNLDNNAEMDDLVDYLIDAAVEKWKGN